MRRTSAETIGDQIRKIILHEISAGTFAPGEQLPTERELAERFGVSLAPLRSALTDLTKAGVIERIQGRGTYVRDAVIPIQLGVLPSFTDGMRALGLPFSVAVLDFGVGEPPPGLAKELGMRKAPKEGFRVRRLVAVRNIPAACLDAWFFPASFGSPLDRDRIEGGSSIYRIARERDRIVFDNIGGTVTVETTAEAILRLLDLPFSSPIAKAVMSATDKRKRFYEHSTLYCGAKRFILHIRK